MSKSATWENGIIYLVFMNFDFSGVGDAGGLRGSASSGGFWLSLHSANPLENATQETNEVVYGSYARQQVLRDSVQWNPQLNVTVSFPKGTGGSDLATHVGIGTSQTGPGKLLYAAPLAIPLNCGLGITPTVTGGSISES